MGVMWLLVAAVVVVIVAVVAAVVLRRPEGGDLSSVERYHSALGTMEQVAERSGSAPVRIVGASGGAAAHLDDTGVGSASGARSEADPSPDPQAGRRYPPASTRGMVAIPEPGSPLVFDDQSPTDGPPPRSRSDRTQRHALASMNRRPRRGSAITVIVVIVVVVVALVLIGSRRSPGGNHGHTAAGTPATTPTTTGSTPKSTSASTSPGSDNGHHAGDKSKDGGKSKKTKTTPTTLPASIVATSTGTGVATYPVPSTSFSVTVTAVGPCWVLARSVATGATLWTGTLQSGAVQTIPATGTTTVELGSQQGALKVGTVPVVLPHPLATPFVATFQPASTPPTSSPSSSPA